MGHKGDIILASCSSDEHLANKFRDFFMRKITTIRDDIDNHKSPISDAIVMRADMKFEGQPQHSLRLTGCALSWIKSYLSDRSQCVAI